MKTNLFKTTSLGFLILFLTLQSTFAQQNCLTDDFSNAGLWTHAGVENNQPTNTVSVTTGALRFNNTIGHTEDRVWRAVNAFDTWRVDFDFNPTAQSNAAHSIFNYTSSNNDPWYTGVYGNATNHNACAINYISNGGTPVLNMAARVGLNGVANANAGIAANVNATYFIRYERINGVTLRLSVFNNQARTSHVPGSPITMTIPCELNGLQFIQSANGWGSGTHRSLSANIDNLSLCNIPTEPVINGSLPLPSVNNVTGCTGTASKFTVNSPIANVTYKWYNSTSGGSVLSTGTTYTLPVFNSPVTYTYYVSYMNSCGQESNRQAVTVQINQAPQPAVITGSTSVCVNQISELFASVPNGVWSSPAPFIASVKQNGVVTGVAKGNTAIIYTLTSGSCSTYTGYNVVVNDVLGFYISGPSVLCPSTSGNKYEVVTSVADADYTWNIQNAPSVGVNFPVNGSNTTLLTTPASGVSTFILRCQGRNACGLSPMITKTINISTDVPPQPNVMCTGTPTPDNSCTNLTVTNNAGYTIEWTTASGTVLGTGTSIVRPLSTTIYCKYTSAFGCTSRTAYSPAVTCTYAARVALDPNTTSKSELKSSLNLYPNPNNGEFSFETTGYNGHAQVLNLLGLVVKEFDLVETQKVYHVDMQDQAKTKYLLRITGGSEAQSTLFVVQ